MSIYHRLGQGRRKDPPPTPRSGASRMLRGLMLGRVQIFRARADV